MREIARSVGENQKLVASVSKPRPCECPESWSRVMHDRTLFGRGCEPRQSSSPAQGGGRCANAPVFLAHARGFPRLPVQGGQAACRLEAAALKAAFEQTH